MDSCLRFVPSAPFRKLQCGELNECRISTTSYLVSLTYPASFSRAELKMACGRIQIASNKKAALLKQSMREVAVLLAEVPPKEEKARIRAEALIRDDHLIEAYEILQLECELLHERIKLIQYSKSCPHDLVSVISTLIWASHRVDIPELLLIRRQFTAKYGKAFEENAMRNYDGCLNERVVSKLSVEPPAAYLVQTYLERICEQFNVEWTPAMKLSANQMIEPMAAPIGYSVAVAQGTGLGPTATITAYTGHATVSSDAIPPAVPTAPPSTIPSNIRGGGSVGASTSSAPAALGNDDLFDEPDIFVPGPAVPPPAVNSTTQFSKGVDDDDNDSIGPAPGDDGKGDLSDSYSNLAARFSQLKK
jgi:vacuolar protein sorting-associated protein IST1